MKLLKRIFLFIFILFSLLLGVITFVAIKYEKQVLDFVKIELGNPDEDYKNEKGNYELVYLTKKYGIPCERKFEVDTNSIVIGFVSNGCF